MTGHCLARYVNSWKGGPWAPVGRRRLPHCRWREPIRSLLRLVPPAASMPSPDDAPGAAIAEDAAINPSRVWSAAGVVHGAGAQSWRFEH